MPRKIDPRVTSDRKPPGWFIEELKALDPYLQVEWWNVGINPNIGPSFRLIRVLPDGRWAHVDWFKMCSMNYIRYLRSIDQHKSDPTEDSRRVYNASRQAYIDEKLARDKLVEETFDNYGEEFAQDVSREVRHGQRIYSHTK